jgi:hypothetical protein
MVQGLGLVSLVEQHVSVRGNAGVRPDIARGGCEPPSYPINDHLPSRP